MNKNYYIAKVDFQRPGFGNVTKGDMFEKTPQSDHMKSLGYFVKNPDFDDVKVKDVGTKPAATKQKTAKK